MPMVIFIVRPLIGKGVGMVVVPRTTIADTVVIFVDVLRLVLATAVMTAVDIVPMVLVVARPLGLIGMFVVIVPAATVADAIIIGIVVGGFSRLHRMITGSGVPVVVLVTGPFLGKRMLVVAVVETDIASAVLVFVHVVSQIRLEIVTAGRLIPVRSLVERPRCIKGMLMGRFGLRILAAFVTSGQKANQKNRAKQKT